MTDPRVTAIIPTFRRPQLVRRAIESVLAQTYPHLRVLVCDNDSGDETESVVTTLARRDDRVIYHRQPENIGSLRNFQYGFDRVDTEYFCILSDDDMLLPQFFELAMRGMQRHPEAKFFCGQSVVYDEVDGTHSLRPRRHWEPGLHEAGRRTVHMLDHFFIWTSCVFSSCIREAVGPLANTPQTDVIYVVRAAALFPFVVDLEPCAVFVHTGANNSLTMSPELLRNAGQVLRESLLDLPGLDAAQREQIEAGIENMIHVSANGLLRSALARGERARFEELAEYVGGGGDLSARRRLRIALARSSAAGFSLMSGMTKITDGYGRRKRSGLKGQPMEVVVAQYAERRGEEVVSSQ